MTGCHNQLNGIAPSQALFNAQHTLTTKSSTAEPFSDFIVTISFATTPVAESIWNL